MGRLLEPDITSLQNPKLKEALNLWDRKEREKAGLFIIEGYRELSRAALKKWEVITLFYCSPLFLGSNETELIEQLTRRGTKAYSCSEKIFRKLSYRDRPDGLVAIARQKKSSLDDLLIKKASLFVVAEAIEKPGNLGTILRSADAVSVDGVIVADPCTDVYNPNVVRASVGTLFTIPVVQTTSANTLKWLKEKGITIVAATPSAKAMYTQVDLTGPVAIAVGTEQLGLSNLWMHEAEIQVRIPMLGIADSLNVAMATTLLLYEVLRQRS